MHGARLGNLLNQLPNLPAPYKNSLLFYYPLYATIFKSYKVSALRKG